MKSNEAPEKIYIVIDPIWGSMSVNYNRNDTNNIEYTSTDVFIEKACDYLMEYEFNDSPTIADRRKRVDEFRKYMEGE